MKTHSIQITACLFFLSSFLPLSAWATHIIGGEITYSCLGGNQYEITMQLFRDCDTGIPLFDDPAILNVLSAGGANLFSIDMIFKGSDTLDFAVFSCYGISSNACIETTIYRETITLPFRIGGYQLTYNICCRNQDILNIIDPTSAQATYHAFISQAALSSCNNGAKFNDWPDFYVCNGVAMQIDHSAIDTDGDSIAYELYTPYDWDYNTPVTWQIPYNVNNMMGLPFPFAIHPTTGLITGTPFINGTFVVGICAKEYRNGQLISTTRRDFQFIVLACLNVVAADFETNIPLCNSSLSVEFTNTSTPLVGDYLWDFGDGSGATGMNALHTYQDTGTYTVSLFIGIGTPCADTVFKEIPLYQSMIDLNIITAPVVCNADEILLVAQNTYAYFNEDIVYTWTPTSNIVSGQGTDSVWIAFTGGTSFAMSVVAVNGLGCSDTIETQVVNLPIELVEAAFDSITFSCNSSLTISFSNQSSVANNQFLWTFDTLATSTDVHPTYTFPDSGTYTIGLVAGVGQYCQDTVYRVLHIPLNGVNIEALDTQIVCKGDTVLLIANTSLPNYYEIINYEWTPAANIITGQGTDSILVFANADLTFNVVATNTENCKDTATANVNITATTPPLDILAIPDSIFIGQTAQLYATNFLEYTYYWQPDTTLSAEDIHNPEAKPRQTTTYYLTVSNQYCTDNDSVTIYLKDALCGNPIVFVPNAFSPNGDGQNDVLMVNGNNINQLNMAIYNRWGQKVFETNDQNIGWDGSFKGQALPPDVYGFYMQCTCNEGGKLFLKGNITLLR